MPLTIDNISKRYGEKAVLTGFSHTFPAVGTVALMGPSGCGKTTLLRLIAGLERPDAGKIVLPDHRRLSMVFQEDRLLPTLTARENLLAVLGKKSDRNRQWADYCLGRCGLGGEEDRYPGELSGGMNRRVAIARAMAFQGGILVLDEPFKGLDESTKDKVQDFVLDEEVSRERLTLLVTHDPAEAERADVILHLTGPPLQITE